MFAPDDHTGRLPSHPPHGRSVRDLQIPHRSRPPQVAPLPPTRFPPYGVFVRRPRAQPARPQRAGVRNPSVKRTNLIVSLDVAIGRIADLQGSRREQAESAGDRVLGVTADRLISARSRPSFVGPRRRSGVVQRRLRQPRASKATKLVAVVNVTTAGRSASKSRRRCSRARTR